MEEWLQSVSYAGSVWHHCTEIDPVAMLKMRTRQKVYLAKYGMQSMLQWGDIDLCEFVGYHDELSELVGRENP